MMKPAAVPTTIQEAIEMNEMHLLAISGKRRRDELSKEWRITEREDYAERQAKRNAIFDKIANREDWKAPIACWIERSEFEECGMACWYFTGTKLRISKRSGSKVFVEAAGYYSHGWA
jgi:hypothetical protein